MLVAEILFYKKFCDNFENLGFQFNSYNPCVANRIKVGKKHIAIYDVGEVMYSYLNPKVNDNFN